MPAMVANNGNAMTLWNAGLIAATNVPITANFENLAASLRETPLPNSDMDDVAQVFVGPDGQGRWSTPMLHNVAMKGGYNAIRLFLELKWVGDRHEVSILAELGRGAEAASQPAKTAWDNSTLLRVANPATPNIIPRYDLLAAQIDNILKQSGKLGMGVILTLGDFYSGATGSLWASQALQDELVMFWKLTAQRWVGHPALIGYELINEPAPGILNQETEPKSMPYNDMRQPGQLHNYKALMERCVAAIRLSDQATPIIVSSPSGGDPAAMDYFLGTSSADSSQLIQDTSTLGERIVYTVHCYAPTRYTHQGIFSGTFHSIGLCYPNLIGAQHEDRNGQSNRPAYDFRNRDISSGGMAQIFANVAKFRRDYNRPVFVGEFSACSSAFLERISTGTELWNGLPTSDWHNSGNAAGITRVDPSRAIVGMHYDPAKNEGFLIMRGAIALYDTTSTDALGRPRLKNTVDLVINPPQLPNPYQVEFEDPSTLQGWGELGILKDVTLEGIWYGYNDEANPHQGENCLIRFPWPAGKSAPAATSLGLSLTQPDPVTGLPVLKTPQAIVGYIRGLDEALARAIKDLNQDPNNSVKQQAVVDAQAAVDALQNIASINIMLSEARVKAQEASRVVYARDVLRQCAQLGLSWAWFADDDFVGQYPYGAHFWQVDNPVMPLAGDQGRLRALLRRSAHQSYED